MKSEVDTSILNSVNIKRFTKSVLEEHGASLDRSNSAKWQVDFPAGLSQELDRQQGTLVFDPADKTLGEGDLLVQPGTRVFSALLDLVQKPASLGRLRLTEDNLQINPPDVFEPSNLGVDITEFQKNDSDFALTFHFRVQFETPASFHSEEMFSVTIDPQTQARLPDLTARLTSHLPQLLQQNNEGERRSVSEAAVQESFSKAQQAVINRSRPIISEIQTEADDSATERIDEIRSWYEQRQSELDEQITSQVEEIRKWNKKYRKARKDSTRRKYINNKREAERNLEQLKKTVEKKKRELDEEEATEIDEVIDRNEVKVDVSLVGVTEITYVRGTLTLDIQSSQVQTQAEVTYHPATDEYHGLDCEVCSRDLTEGVLPRLCSNGHLVGDPCSNSCRNCDLAYCDDCDTTATLDNCTVCLEDVCQSCVEVCLTCESAVCSDHTDICDSCGQATCHLCGEECTTCGSFHCDTHLELCSECDDYHCDTHTDSCAQCGSVRCEAHLETCDTCGDLLCEDHTASCATCDETVCDDHVEYCEVCLAHSVAEPRGFCDHHTEHCSVGGEVLCATHRDSTTLGSGHVCENHRAACSTCTIEYRETNLTNGQCSACNSLGEVDEDHIPTVVSKEYRSVKAGANDAYMVILGKQLLGRNKLIVYDIKTGEEAHRQSAGLLKQLLGGI
ncbi:MULTISPECIES: hypothetical protein [Haloferax]|uniref:Uncharacterized protein n=2 Tax=Haloferax TaxID=2251 RepID=A0A6G1Z797_9EURY|nr:MULTISPECIES: hypothetical protein [Haloferax]KAB1184795.1 hypothetical protein Hfx1149_17175 [Haloferax sp. CBA1149]MRW82426.1 hypothetical protein [Haloferax marinisediminis]